MDFCHFCIDRFSWTWCPIVEPQGSTWENGPLDAARIETSHVSATKFYAENVKRPSSTDCQKRG